MSIVWCGGVEWCGVKVLGKWLQNRQQLIQWKCFTTTHMVNTVTIRMKIDNIYLYIDMESRQIYHDRKYEYFMFIACQNKII